MQSTSTFKPFSLHLKIYLLLPLSPNQGKQKKGDSKKSKELSLVQT